MNTTSENRLNQLVNEMKAVKEELAKTKSALETYTKPPPSQTTIEGGPFCTRFFINVLSSTKPITTRSFATHLHKFLPNDTGIYAVARGRGFRSKGDLFLLEAVVIAKEYMYIPTIVSGMFEALLNDGYFVGNEDYPVLSFVNLQRTADATGVLRDIVTMQMEVSGLEQGIIITLSPSGELDESLFSLDELPLLMEDERREYPLMNVDGTCRRNVYTSN